MAFATGTVTLVLLVIGAYVIAVLEQLLTATAPRWRAVVFPFAGAVKLSRRESLTPRGADRLLFWSAPVIAFVAVALAAPVLPVAPGFVATDTPISLFYFLVILGPFVIAMMNAGWGQTPSSVSSAPSAPLRTC